MLARILIASLTASVLLASANADVQDNDAPAEDDGLVRLPGQGELKAPPPRSPERRKPRTARLVPGGGLLLSFDVDQNGQVSPEEISEGAARAFLEADASADGTLTALEQQAWAAQLPTRDDTLANPVRFDPNLDRQVSQAEFTAVIRQIALPYVDAATGDVPMASLDAPVERPRDAREVLRPDPRRIGRDQRAGL